MRMQINIKRINFSSEFSEDIYKNHFRRTTTEDYLQLQLGYPHPKRGKKVNKLTLALALTAAIATASTAQAASKDRHGFQMGGAIGYTKTSIDLGPMADSHHTFSDDDMSGGAFKLFGEYNFNKYFALGGELNYLDQGKVNETISYGPYYRATYDYKFYTVVYGIYAKGSLPVTDNFDVFVKAGPTWNYTSSDTLSDGTKDENCFGWNAGAGVEYRFDNGWGIRAGYDYYHKTIKSLGNRLTGVFDSANSNLIYGGVSYSF